MADIAGRYKRACRRLILAVSLFAPGMILSALCSHRSVLESVADPIDVRQIFLENRLASGSQGNGMAVVNFERAVIPSCSLH